MLAIKAQTISELIDYLFLRLYPLLRLLYVHSIGVKYKCIISHCIVSHAITSYCIALYHIVSCHSALYCHIAKYHIEAICIVSHCFALYDIIQYHSVSHCNVLYCIAPVLLYHVASEISYCIFIIFINNIYIVSYRIVWSKVSTGSSFLNVRISCYFYLVIYES